MTPGTKLGPHEHIIVMAMIMILGRDFHALKTEQAKF